MDRLEQLGNSLSQITAYDIKSYYNAAKAAVMNYSEMETKVREATNDDPWGASSTLMKEIASGTFNFQDFNEIMPTIYKRFTEKEAREWRQIYKALQLLEYLIKHGSERVIDDARSHISMIKILRSFHYIDDKGKDQGINVRNRAKEIAELLSDSDKVRAERRKARANRNKYTGTGNEVSSFGGGGPSFSSGGSRYGGFGSETFYGGSGGGGDDEYGRDRWAGSSSHHRSTAGGGGGDDFEEYDAGDWDDRRSRSGASNRHHNGTESRVKSPSEPAPPPKKPVKEVDLFSLDDDEQQAPAPPPASAKSAAPAVSLDDEFDDFQSASAGPQAAAVAKAAPTSPVSPSSGAAKANFFDMLEASVPSPAGARPAAASPPPLAAAAAAKPAVQQQGSFFTGQQPVQPQAKTSQPGSDFFGSTNKLPFGTGPSTATSSLFSSGGGLSSPGSIVASRPATLSSTTSFTSAGGYKPPTPATNPTSAGLGGTGSKKDDFGDLFSFGGGAGATTAKAGGPAGQKISMATMAQQQSSATIWGDAPPSATKSGASNVARPGSFGSFSNGKTPAASSGGGFGGGADDDLLL